MSTFAADRLDVGRILRARSRRRLRDIDAETRSRVARELEACRSSWVDGLEGVAKKITVTRIDKYEKRRARTLGGLVALWASLGVMVSALVALVVLAVLSFPLIDVLPRESGLASLACAVAFVCCLPPVTALCTAEAFARGSEVIYRAIVVLRALLVHGSAVVSCVTLAFWLSAETRGDLEILTPVVSAAILACQMFVVLLGYAGLAMSPSLLEVRSQRSQISRVHRACTSLYASLFVLLLLVVLAFARDARSGALPVALVFAVSTWVFVQLGTVRKELGQVSEEVLDTLTELESSFGIVRTEGASQSFTADQRSCVLRLQSMVHRKMPSLLPGAHGRPVTDHAITVIVDYLATRVAAEAPTKLVVARSDFFEDRLDSAGDQEIQYLAADFITALRSRCLA